MCTCPGGSVCGCHTGRQGAHRGHMGTSCREALGQQMGSHLMWTDMGLWGHVLHTGTEDTYTRLGTWVHTMLALGLSVETVESWACACGAVYGHSGSDVTLMVAVARGLGPGQSAGLQRVHVHRDRTGGFGLGLSAVYRPDGSEAG
eukprot:comp19976_c0_seq1/m.24378 comp19976_c0_seq1/g.24378  ORF comp19976_c0_seq1/g.24378 comp19976_c0_seq1/m.24378 type:complete len:146 (-) comp19976_c0_seq1:485-922(-)